MRAVDGRRSFVGRAVAGLALAGSLALAASAGSSGTGGSGFFVAYGFGDGSAGDCWCYGNSAPGAGEGCRNSTGAGAILSGSGSTSVSAGDMLLTGRQLVPGQPALLFAGTLEEDGLPFGDGLRFVGGALTRLGARTPDDTGSAEWEGLTALGHWQGGDTRFFQIWYRDPALSFCSTFYNLSSALQVQFVD